MFDSLKGMYDPLDSWDVVYDADGDSVGNPLAGTTIGTVATSAARVGTAGAIAAGVVGTAAAAVAGLGVVGWTVIAAGTTYAAYKSGLYGETAKIAGKIAKAVL